MSQPNPFGKTPESKAAGLGRKDSKYALTTCHGVTKSGSPCRNPLASKNPTTSPKYSRKGDVLVPHKDRDPSIFFCHLHKDQTTTYDATKPNKSVKVSLKEKPSLESLFHSLGLEDKKEKKSSQASQVSQTLQPTSQPKVSKQDQPQPNSSTKSLSKKSKSGLFKKIKFLGITFKSYDPLLSPSKSSPKKPTRTDTENLEQKVKRRPVPSPLQATKAHAVTNGRRDSMSPTTKVYRHSNKSTHRATASQPNIHLTSIDRKSLAHRAKSAPAVTNWLPSIPPNADDTMLSAYSKLLAEMAKPASSTDEEGYIYMFWESDLNQSKEEVKAAASLVGGASKDHLSIQESELILQKRFLQGKSPSTSEQKRALSLKIGESKNVHARINNWRSQCGYNYSILRYWPCESGVKVANKKKVERLIHLHLKMLGKQVKRQCRCGTEHQEWFEINATTTEVKQVNDIIEQWVKWMENKTSIKKP